MIKKLFVRKAFVIFGIISLAVLGFGAFVWAEGGVITVCVTDTGLLRLIDSEPGIQAANCKKTLSWNIQGEKGDKGDKGDTGLQGPAGQQLHLFDGNGQDLGISRGDTKTYLPTLGVLAEFYISGQQVVTMLTRGGGDLFFDQPDCAGAVYVRMGQNGTPEQIQAVFAMNPDFPGRFRIVPGSQFGSFVSRSYPSGDARRCINSTATQMGWLLEPVTFPFVEPLAYPLRIVSTNQ